MTYTTVYKDYPADTFEAAAAAMLRDPEVWRLAEPTPAGTTERIFSVRAGERTAYQLDSWEWHENEPGRPAFLRARFR